jgi:predicted  nucleic acid-binding Zn-ribbon protein
LLPVLLNLCSLSARESNDLGIRRAQEKTMPGDKTAKSALEGLKKVLSRLENALDQRVEKARDYADAEEEMQRLNADRSRLAQELDQSEERASRLEEANREVSRRLVTAMETIRAVLDR